MKPAEEFQPKQGEVYRSELPDGAGEHMVVVVSADRFNRGESVMAVPFTSKNVDERARLNNCVVFEANSYPFLMVRSVTPADWMDWLWTGRTSRPIGVLSQNDLNRILAAVAFYFDIPAWIDADDAT